MPPGLGLFRLMLRGSPPWRPARSACVPRLATGWRAIWGALLCTLLWPADPVLGWSFAGHMLCGSRVYTLLRERDASRAADWADVLRAHPHYPGEWRAICAELPPDREAEVLFMLAARWPDDIRDAPWRAVHHRRAWHFVNYTVRFPGAPADIPDGIIPATPEPGEDPEGCHQLETALAYNLARMRGAEPAERRAVALCWVLHLASDLHQPLHACNRYALRAPRGDRGGNSAFILERPGEPPTNLHAYWDNRLLSRLTGAGVLKSTPGGVAREIGEVWRFADEWSRRPDLDPATWPELRHDTIAEWAAESVQLAREVVYDEGRLEVGAQPAEAVPLPEGYAERATRAAERRLQLSIARLVELLRP
ncbi:MAG: S1/P1 nuclease [Planctomycetaceae bacterium]